MKKYLDAKSDFDTLLVLVPGHESGLNQRGIAKIKLGENESACEDFFESYKQGVSAAKVNIDKYCIKPDKAPKIILEDIQSGEEIAISDDYADFDKVSDINLQVGGVLSNETIARFSIVSNGPNRFVIERLYIKVHGYSECPKRNEYTTSQGFKDIQAYYIYLSGNHAEYDLIPQEPVGGLSTWEFKSKDNEEFFVRFSMPSYTLFLVSFELIARNIDDNKKINRSSKIYPLIKVERGNTGGCLDFEDWYEPNNLVAPKSVKYKTDIGTLEYQLLTADLDQNSVYLDKVGKDKIEGIMESLALVSSKFPENLSFRSNLNKIRKFVNK